jgi:hypothetical protein
MKTAELIQKTFFLPNLSEILGIKSSEIAIPSAKNKPKYLGTIAD